MTIFQSGTDTHMPEYALPSTCIQQGYKLEQSPVRCSITAADCSIRVYIEFFCDVEFDKQVFVV